MRYCYGFIIFLLTAMPALAQQPQRLQTVAGTLVLDQDNSGDCRLLLNQQVAQKFNCQAAYPPQVLGHFKGNLGSFQEVVVLQEMPMGNACNGGSLYFLGIRPNKSYQISAPLDFCGGKPPILTRRGNKIVVTMPGGQPNRGTGYIPPRIWQYENGKVTRVRPLILEH